MAALIEVAESVREPVLYCDVNKGGSIQLIDSALEAGIGAFVLSSTSAVYGVPVRVPMDEIHPTKPVNPYGCSKLMAERHVEAARPLGIRTAVLRSFNAAGADPLARIGEHRARETHGLPLAIEAALGRRIPFSIFGSDYNTPDGTPVRDYVHVVDIADAHVLAVRHLLDGGDGGTFNLGLGRGISVKELLAAVSEVAGTAVPVVEVGRREGDVPVLIADGRRAQEILGWRPNYDFSAMVRTSWAWAKTTN